MLSANWAVLGKALQTADAGAMCLPLTVIYDQWSGCIAAARDGLRV